MKRVLVLLAAFNGECWIEAQLESVLVQEGVEVSVLLGDDASRDGTRRVVAARWGQDARVRLEAWPTPSGSASANFLRLMRHADARGFDAVALSDQDDVWLPGKLSAALKALEDSGASAYSAAVEAFWGSGRSAVISQNPHTRSADFLFEGAGQGCTFVLAPEFFARVQTFLRGAQGRDVDMHFHDWMLYVLCRAWNGRWLFDPQPRLRYRQHEGNDIGARGGLSGLTRRMSKIRDGWYAAQVVKACKTFLAAGGNDPVVLALSHRLCAGPARGRLASLQLAASLWRNGRRRALDRAVLVFAAFAGWL